MTEDTNQDQPQPEEPALTGAEKLAEQATQEFPIRPMPGQVIVLPLEHLAEQSRGGLAIVGADKAHKQKMGTHFHRGMLAECGEANPLSDLDGRMADLVGPGDIVWYDYRGACAVEHLAEGISCLIVKRESIRGKLGDEAKARFMASAFATEEEAAVAEKNLKQSVEDSGLIVPPGSV